MRPLPPKQVGSDRGPPQEPAPVVRRYFTRRGDSPLDLVGWERRVVGAEPEAGAAGRRRQVEVPWFWSQDATHAFAHNLLPAATEGGMPEWSVRQLLRRVVTTLGLWGRDGGYLTDDETARTFEAELAHLLVHQMAALNTPAWLALGVEPEPQCCACPVTSLGQLPATSPDLSGGGELLLRDGAGAGLNLSAIPSAREGNGAGPVPVMGGLETLVAALGRAAGTTPRARSVVLTVGHPDIRAFVTAPQPVESDRRRGCPPGRAVRLPDAFMEAVATDGWWETRAVATGEVVTRERARGLLELIVGHALLAGHPAVQFEDTVNRWNTCSGWGRIVASSPCGEHMFLDDTACQLACLNLLPFVDGAGRLRTEALRRAVEVAALALEIMVGQTRYPQARVAARTRELRPLGLGYANLAAALMACGLQYDSDRGRTTAAAVTSLVTGSAYAQSARLAAVVGSFSGYPANRPAMLEVLDRHREAAHRIPRQLGAEIRGPAVGVWDEAITLGTRFGFRNAQVTTLAPTVTVARLMDCASTAHQPVGRGRDDGPYGDLLARSLERLGYPPSALRPVLQELRTEVDPERWTCLATSHRGVFAPPTALARLRMAAAAQPFLSGAAVADLVVPTATSPTDAQALVVQGWKLGVKALTLRRAAGPTVDDLLAAAEVTCQCRPTPPAHRALPAPPRLLAHRFAAAGHEGEVTVSLDHNGCPGEVAISLARPTSGLAGAAATVADTITAGLQRGLPLEEVLSGLEQLRHRQVWWGDPVRASANAALVDQVVAWLTARFASATPSSTAGAPPRPPGTTH